MLPTILKQNNFINELIRNNYHITKTCKICNISKKTYYDWKTDPNFSKKIEALRDSEGDVFEDALRDLVKEKNPQAVIFGLKTRFANRGYQDKQQIEHFGAAGIEISFTDPGEKNEKIIDVEKEEEN